MLVRDEDSQALDFQQRSPTSDRFKPELADPLKRRLLQSESPASAARTRAIHSDVRRGGARHCRWSLLLFSHVYGVNVAANLV